MSLGEAMALREIGVRKASYPFDWLVPNKEKQEKEYL